MGASGCLPPLLPRSAHGPTLSASYFQSSQSLFFLTLLALLPTHLNLLPHRGPAFFFQPVLFHPKVRGLHAYLLLDASESAVCVVAVARPNPGTRNSGVNEQAQGLFS